ncbi:MAG TPA: IclR family transcriptional regulator [Nocardioidaceae bacterium]|nr:IclR family transcriptional regulator [Nocardioidaceae bacterium]
MANVGGGEASGDAYAIDSVGNALRTLLYLRDVDEVRVSELATHLGVAASTAHRLLATLRANDFVEQVPGRRAYRLTSLLSTFSGGPPDRETLAHIGRPALVQLCRDTDETANLLVLEGADARFIDGVESTRTLRVAPRTGDLLPAHGTAGGKALLAMLPPEQVRALLGKRLRKMTTHTVLSRSAFEKELAVVRGRGYATNVNESVLDVGGVGVPVMDRFDRCVAAITVSGPSSRLNEETAPSLLPYLRSAAARMASRL